MKGLKEGIVGLVLIIVLLGYAYQLISRQADVNFTILFMLNLIILYVVLMDLKIKRNK